MATAGTAQGKICGFCGQDCSAKPRVKDKDGRYFCKACVEQREADVAAAQAKARAAAPAPTAPRPARPAAPPAAAGAAEDDDVMLSLVDGSAQASTTPCPGCQTPLMSGSLVCMSCGYNLQTGKAAGTAVRKAPKGPKTAKIPRIPMSPGVAGLILLVVFGALLAGGLSSAPIAALYYGLLLLLGTGVWIATIVCAFKDGSPGWGILTLIPFTAFLMLYYVPFVSERAYLKVCFLVCVVFGVLNVVFSAQLIEQFKTLQ